MCSVTPGSIIMKLISFNCIPFNSSDDRKKKRINNENGCALMRPKPKIEWRKKRATRWPLWFAWNIHTCLLHEYDINETFIGYIIWWKWRKTRVITDKKSVWSHYFILMKTHIINCVTDMVLIQFNYSAYTTYMKVLCILLKFIKV